MREWDHPTSRTGRWEVADAAETVFRRADAEAPRAGWRGRSSRALEVPQRHRGCAGDSLAGSAERGAELLCVSRCEASPSSLRRSLVAAPSR
jgi:hypothetical protein